VDAVAAMLNRRVDWIADGTLPAGQVANIRFADFSSRPIETLRQLYRDLGLALAVDTERKFSDYLARKPKGVFGVHAYSSGDEAVIRSERSLFDRYQRYFQVPNE